MFAVGNLVRVLEPFGLKYTGEYIVIDINEDGVVFLEGVEGAFDPIYLEAV